MLKRGQAGSGATDPLRRRCTTVATFLITVNLGELKELYKEQKQSALVLDSMCMYVLPSV